MAGGCASARVDHVGVGVEVDDLAVLLYIMEKFLGNSQISWKEKPFFFKRRKGCDYSIFEFYPKSC